MIARDISETKARMTGDVVVLPEDSLAYTGDAASAKPFAESELYAFELLSRSLSI